MKKECYEFLKNEIGRTNIVGFGSYGQVKIARNTENGQIVAIKLIYGKNAKQQIDVHNKLNHPNIIKLLNYYYEKEKNMTYMVLEYAQNGTLNEKIKFGLGKLSKQLIRKYFKDICESIKYLHSHNYMHRDIKPQNILITKDNSAKLCDLGFAAIFQTRTTICGTLEYMAPQMINKKNYDYKIDIWALGILLFEMIQGIAPFRGQTSEQVIAQMKKAIHFSSRFDSLEIELIKKILRVNAQNRPTVQQILDHPYFKPLKQDEKANLARNTVEIHFKYSKAEKTQSNSIKEKWNYSEQQTRKILKIINQKLAYKLQSPFETKNFSHFVQNHLKTQPNLNQNYANNNVVNSFNTKNHQVLEIINKSHEYKMYNNNPFGAESPQGQKKTRLPVSIKTQRKNEPIKLDNFTRTQKKTFINAHLFGNNYNSSVKTLSVLNKSKLNGYVGIDKSISGKICQKARLDQQNASSMQYFNKNFTNLKAIESLSYPVLRKSNPVVTGLKQQGATFGIETRSKKIASMNSSVNVSFKYSEADKKQGQSSNKAISSQQQSYQARKHGAQETGFSYNQIYDLQKTANSDMNGPKIINLSKLKESFK